jgi:hypothetical protein
VKLPTSSCHGVLYPRYYGLVGTFSSKPPGGSRGVVILSPREWKGCQWLGTRDWYLMHYSNPYITGGQKTHTHTHLPLLVPHHPSRIKELILCDVLFGNPDIIPPNKPDYAPLSYFTSTQRNNSAGGRQCSTNNCLMSLQPKSSTNTVHPQ